MRSDDDIVVFIWIHIAARNIGSSRVSLGILQAMIVLMGSSDHKDQAASSACLHNGPLLLHVPVEAS